MAIQRTQTFEDTGSELIPNHALMQVMRLEVVVPIGRLARAERAWSTQPAPVGPLNRVLVAGLDARWAGYRDLDLYFGNGNIATARRAVAELKRSAAILDRWQTAVAHLR